MKTLRRLTAVGLVLAAAGFAVRPARGADRLSAGGVHGQAGRRSAKALGKGTSSSSAARSAGGHPVPAGQRLLLLHRQRGPERGDGARRGDGRGHALPASQTAGEIRAHRQELADRPRAGKPLGLRGDPAARRAAGGARARLHARPSRCSGCGSRPATRPDINRGEHATDLSRRLVNVGGTHLTEDASRAAVLPRRTSPLSRSPTSRRSSTRCGRSRARGRLRSCAQRAHQRRGHPPGDPGDARERLRVPDRGRGHLLPVPERRAGELVPRRLSAPARTSTSGTTRRTAAGTRTATWW